MKWLRPEEHTKEDIVESVFVEQWVMCHQPQTLEDAIGLMEVCVSTESGIYFMKNLKRQAARAKQSKNSCKGDRKLPSDSPFNKETQARDSGLDLPTPLFNQSKPKGLTGKCFGFGHYQAKCPHMDFTWVKSFRGIQVGPLPLLLH